MYFCDTKPVSCDFPLSCPVWMHFLFWVNFSIADWCLSVMFDFSYSCCFLHRVCWHSLRHCEPDYTLHQDTWLLGNRTHDLQLFYCHSTSHITRWVNWTPVNLPLQKTASKPLEHTEREKCIGAIHYQMLSSHLRVSVKEVCMFIAYLPSSFLGILRCLVGCCCEKCTRTEPPSSAFGISTTKDIHTYDTHTWNNQLIQCNTSQNKKN